MERKVDWRDLVHRAIKTRISGALSASAIIAEFAVPTSPDPPRSDGEQRWAQLNQLRTALRPCDLRPNNHATPKLRAERGG